MNRTTYRKGITVHTVTQSFLIFCATVGCAQEKSDGKSCMKNTKPKPERENLHTRISQLYVSGQMSLVSMLVRLSVSDSFAQILALDRCSH